MNLYSFRAKAPIEFEVSANDRSFESLVAFVGMIVERGKTQGQDAVPFVFVIRGSALCDNDRESLKDLVEGTADRIMFA